MITLTRSLLGLGFVLSAGTALADQACTEQYVQVTDTRLTDDAVVEADIQNKTSFVMIGYDLSFSFMTDDGTVNHQLPSYMMKLGINPGATHTHRMVLSQFDVDAADVTGVEAHAVFAYRDGVEQPLAALLNNCEET